MADSRFTVGASKSKSKIEEMRKRFNERKKTFGVNATTAKETTRVSTSTLTSATRSETLCTPSPTTGKLQENPVAVNVETIPNVAASSTQEFDQDQGSDDPRVQTVFPSTTSTTATSTAHPSRKRKAPHGPSTPLDVKSLLAATSHKETKSKQISSKISELLNTLSAMEKSSQTKLSSQTGQAVQEFCKSMTVQKCMKDYNTSEPCAKLHWRKIINNFTDQKLGDCTFLNNCKRGVKCRYVHYEMDAKDYSKKSTTSSTTITPVPTESKDLIQTVYDTTDRRTIPAQWIQCDVRRLDMPVIGKFSVIMADPPWDIHMDLPYGTMNDLEMKSLPFKDLMDEGYIFLWVTGRAMELGRDCLKCWGYTMLQELIWVKTNQLQKVIRTGRTGHWLNHGKEHCLLGVKGNPPKSSRVLDCDVLVAEVRDTSHKPDEVYGLIERLSPGTRKLELFARQHNVQKNWVSLGNQLDGINLVEADVIERFNKSYPGDSVEVQKKLLVAQKP